MTKRTISDEPMPHGKSARASGLDDNENEILGMVIDLGPEGCVGEPKKLENRRAMARLIELGFVKKEGRGPEARFSATASGSRAHEGWFAREARLYPSR